MLRTERLLLRQWIDSDVLHFFTMNQDPEVMRFLGGPAPEATSVAMARRCRELITERGWGFWALQTLADDAFIGYIGLHVPNFRIPGDHQVEIGWRLSKSAWHRGFATEGARAAAAFAFDKLKLPELVAFAARGNHDSCKVMRRLGMTWNGEHFEHPDTSVPAALRDPVLYRLRPDELVRG